MARQETTEPRIAHDAVRDFYDREYHAGAGAPEDVGWHSRVIASRLGDLRGKRVLDIACGTGQWLLELQQRGAVPSGIDISVRAVAQCHRVLPSADIREGIAERLPFETASFDLVTCMGSLEHFLDQPGALAEMRRVGSRGARFLILVPNAGFLTRRLGLYRGTHQVAIRETVRPLAEWQALLEGAGMEVRAKWRDLHPLAREWITSGPMHAWPLRAAQACALAAWPLAWQYQVYFYCEGQT
ncbi:MAG: methyltransferase domain-containing protein [Pseudomonadota bacterium]|nr:methyltransferase domain-containing protein [Pseudomonadota bacterium]